MTVKLAMTMIRALGLVASRRDGEWRVNYRSECGGREATAYYTTDAEDAVATAMRMATEERGFWHHCPLPHRPLKEMKNMRATVAAALLRALDLSGQTVELTVRRRRGVWYFCVAIDGEETCVACADEGEASARKAAAERRIEQRADATKIVDWKREE